jgi:hypothetical protein
VRVEALATISSNGRQKSGAEMERARLPALWLRAWLRKNTAAGLLSVVVVNVPMGPASAQPFNPIRKLTTWYTDRSLIDVEIVGSTSLQPDSHRLEPNRVLRFRLERAYLTGLAAQEKPGFEIVSVGVDRETGLAQSLLVAVASKGRFHEEIAGIPLVTHVERVRRTVVINMQSDHSAEQVQRGSAAWKNCLGEPLGDDRFAYEWEGRKSCRKPSYGKITRQLVRYDSDLLLAINCREPSFPGIGCKVRFPFEGFAVEITFHRDHLPRWREVVEFATAFLKSKQFK